MKDACRIQTLSFPFPVSRFGNLMGKVQRAAGNEKFR